MMTSVIAVSVAVLAAWLMLPLARRLVKMRPAPSRPSAPASLARSLARWLDDVPVPLWYVRRRVGAKLTARLKRAGLPWTNEQFMALEWTLAWFGLFAGSCIWAVAPSLPGRFLSVLLIAGGAFGPSIWLGERADDRRQAIERVLPDFLDRLTLALSAGLGFEVALRRTVMATEGVLGDELARCVRYLDWGETKAQAMEALADRNPSPEVRAFVSAVRRAETLGASLNKTLRVQRDLMRARRRRRAQEASRRLPVLIVFPLVFFFLPALLIVYLAPPMLHLFLGR
jgi:tight adherence protein C